MKSSLTMDENNLSRQVIAQAFSTGKFEITFPYLSESVRWKIIGESQKNGKPEMVSSCQQTFEYFNLVKTSFITKDVISNNNKVVFIGSGEIIKKVERIHLISACDVYESNDENFVESISSYGISEQS